MNKLTKIMVGAVAGIMLAATVTTTVFSVIVYSTVKDSEQRDKDKEAEDEALAGETENVLIGDQYQILSTKNISDAYISGDSSDLSDEDKKTLEVADDILKEIITDDMNDYEKEEAIYLWMVQNISIDDSGVVVGNDAAGIVDRPYGVLQNKEAVCVGFATSFRLLANMVGLDCMVMHDTSLSHSWDLVKLDDGCWYIVDCYFDSESESSIYSHFNMNAQLASQDHDWDTAIYPVANGSEYCYAEMNNTEVKDIEDLLSKIAGDVEDGVNKGFYSLKSTEVTAEELNYISTGVSERLMTDSSYADFRLYLNDKDNYIILFDYVDISEQQEEPGDLDYDTLDSLLNNAFGEPDYDYYDEEDYYDNSLEFKQEGIFNE